MKIPISMIYLSVLALFLSSCANDPNQVKTTINFIKGDFVPRTSLTNYFLRSIAPEEVLVKDVTHAGFSPKLGANGFQVEDFRAEASVLGLLSAVKDASRQGLDDAARKLYLQQALGPFEDHMLRWARQNLQSMSFDEVVCGRGYYRNTKISAQRSGKADMQLEVPHIDFYPGQDLSNLFEIIGFNDELKRKIGPQVLDRAYWKQNKMVKMLNIWMPLNTVQAYPLAVLDTATLDFQSDVIPNFARVKGIAGEFESGALRFNPRQQFYFKPGMSKGEAFVFETFGTPHTAIRLPEQKGDRESFDIRCAFIKKSN